MRPAVPGSAGTSNETAETAVSRNPRRCDQHVCPGFWHEQLASSPGRAVPAPTPEAGTDDRTDRSLPLRRTSRTPARTPSTRTAPARPSRAASKGSGGEYDRKVSSMGVIAGTEEGRPVVRGVVLDDSGIELGEMQHLTDLRNDLRTQLDALAKAIETTIQEHSPEVMVIRTGRIHMWERRRTTAARARAEGVLLATCRDHGVHVLVMDGDEVGRAVGRDRASADKAAKAWASKDFVEAGAAALAAHSIAQQGGRSS
jgi:hypothetical protein